jgi:hypothetical protein
MQHWCDLQQVYDWNSEQATIFEITAKPIIDACMDGYNGMLVLQLGKFQTTVCIHLLSGNLLASSSCMQRLLLPTCLIKAVPWPGLLAAP